MRTLTWAAGLAVATATVVVPVSMSASPAAVLANPICQDVQTTGTLTGDREVGPKCFNYGGATFCHYETAGLEPRAEVSVKVCVPALLTNSSDSAAGDA